jgi:cation transport ATPase
MRHSAAFVVIMAGVSMAFAVAIWVGSHWRVSLWGALALLVTGLAIAFVISMAWLWAPRSGIGRGRRPEDGSQDSSP